MAHYTDITTTTLHYIATATTMAHYTAITTTILHYMHTTTTTVQYTNTTILLYNRGDSISYRNIMHVVQQPAGPASSTPPLNLTAQNGYK